MKRKEDFVMQNVGGENILVPIGRQVIDLNGIITLNDTASFLWDMLSSECTVEEMAAALAEKFSLDYQNAINDVEVFVNEISEIGLLD